MKKKIPYNYICIEGNIGAGKTTLTTKLANDLGSKLILEQFAENPFLEYFYKEPERYALAVELFFLAERQKQLQATIMNKDLFAEFTLADYSLIKSMLFAKHNLAPDEFALFQRIFTSLSKVKIDLLFSLLEFKNSSKVANLMFLSSKLIVYVLKLLMKSSNALSELLVVYFLNSFS